MHDFFCVVPDPVSASHRLLPLVHGAGRGALRDDAQRASPFLDHRPVKRVDGGRLRRPRAYDLHEHERELVWPRSAGVVGGGEEGLEGREQGRGGLGLGRTVDDSEVRERREVRELVPVRVQGGVLSRHGRRHALLRAEMDAEVRDALSDESDVPSVATRQPQQMLLLWPFECLERRRGVHFLVRGEGEAACEAVHAATRAQNTVYRVDRALREDAEVLDVCAGEVMRFVRERCEEGGHAARGREHDGVVECRLDETADPCGHPCKGQRRGGVCGGVLEDVVEELVGQLREDTG